MAGSIGDRIPDFQLPAYPDQTITHQNLMGQWTVLYFYPRDNTPGCTQESIAFQAALDQFHNHQTQVIGVSRDSLASHQKFAQKFALSFPLISDSEGYLCQQFSVLKEKMNYGKRYIGIERSTFLINPQGVIAYEWRKVSVNHHVETVLAQLKQLRTEC